MCGTPRDYQRGSLETIDGGMADFTGFRASLRKTNPSHHFAMFLSGKLTQPWVRRVSIGELKSDVVAMLVTCGVLSLHSIVY